MATLKKEFTQADLDGTNKLVYYHGTNTTEYAPLLYDNNNVQRTTIDIFSILDANTIVLELGNAITGTWTLYLQALTDVGGGTVRELHDLDIENAPTTDYRLALGKAGVATKNILLNKFYELLDAGLNFCKRDGSNISNAGDFRTALDVITEAEVISNINSLADVPIRVGSQSIGTLGTNYESRTITFAGVGTSDYHVMYSIVDNQYNSDPNADTTPSHCIYDKLASSFKLRIKENEARASDFIINYRIYLRVS
jgi:hypothetical protein